MKNNTLIQLSSGRTYLGEHTMEKLGAEMKLLGNRALLLTDEAVWYKVEEEVRNSLEQQQISYDILFHQGHCSPASYRKAAEKAVDWGADGIIGIGGGRLLDTAKIASDLAGIRAITVPTSASTCAATAWLSVEYTDDGAFVGNYWTKYPPFCTIIDTDVIVRKCPLRYNLAGIVDAMAKYPEITYNLKFTSRFERNAYSETAKEIAEQNYRLFMSEWQEVKKKLEEGQADAQVEDAIAKAVALTGLVSCLACGGKQAAVSHLLYSYICCYHRHITTRFLHGEIVGASLCYQLAVDCAEKQEIEALRDFLKKAGMPVCMRELGLDLNEKEKEKMFEYLKSGMDISDEEVGRLKQMVSELG